MQLLVLGSGQDCGVPHIGCRCRNCEGARRDPALARTGPSAALVDGAGGIAWLIDASPDLPRQLLALQDALGARVDGAGSSSPRFPVKGVLLTHAHVGHYWGLGYLGREGLMVRELPVYGTSRMVGFLTANRPFRDLVEWGVLRPIVVAPSAPVELAPGLVAVPEPVPHRDDLTDTVAWAVEGPRARALYMPDIDELDGRAEGLVGAADIALVDGTFYRDGELPPDGRKVPHPPVEASLGRLERARIGGTRVIYTHINHTNPLCDPSSPESAEVRRRGMGVARDGMALRL